MSEPEQLELRYVPLATCLGWLWERNPKLHDLSAMHASFQKHGFKEPPRFDPQLNGGTGGISSGNGRVETLAWEQGQGQEPPRGVIVQDGDWLVPVVFGVDAASQQAAEAFSLDANSMSLLGGTFSAMDIARLYDTDSYSAMLKELAEQDSLPVSVDGDDLDMLLKILAMQGGEGGSIDYNAEWQGMPEFEQEDLGAFRSIIVHFRTNEDVENFSQFIDQKITAKAKYIWYPEIEIMHQDLVTENEQS